MKILMNRADLIRLLTQSAIVAKAKTTAPILSCVLLETSSGVVNSVATNLYQSVATSAPAEVTKAGGVAVSCRDLLERVKTLPDGQLTLERDAEKLRLTSGKRRHLLRALPPEEFPPVALKLQDGVSVPGSVLLDLLRKTKHAMAYETDRAQLHAVLLEMSAGQISASSTDGRRMSFAYHIADGCVAQPSRIVPYEAADALAGLVDPNLPVTMGLVGQEFVVRVEGGAVLATKLAEGTFPPCHEIRKVIGEHEALLGRKALIESLTSVGVAAGAEDRLVEFRLSAGSLRLKADGRGGAVDVVAAKYDGDDVVLGANCKYILDALGAIDGDEVRLNLGGELDPIVFRPSDTDTSHQMVAAARLKDAGKPA